MTKSLLYKSAITLGFASLVSRVLGLVRDRFLAGIFGTGGSGVFNLDVYYSAFRIPDFVYALLIMGTVAAAFVPVLTGIMHKNKSGGFHVMSKEASLFTSNVLNTVAVAVLGFSLLAFLFAPWIVKFLVPGFSAENFELTVTLTRLMLVSPFFLGLSSVLASVQNAFDRFFYYSLAPIFYNLGIIIGILFLAKPYGVFGVGIGVVAGAFLHFLIQLPGVKGLRFKYGFHISWRDSALREMMRLVIPRIVGMSIMQVNLIFDTLVGSLLMGGSITVLNYAVNLNSLPMGLIGVSFAIASFATLSNLAISSKVKFAREIGNVVTGVLYFTIPAGVGLFVLRFPIVDLILGYGAFTERDVTLTANTLAFFLIGLVGQSLIPVFARAFYAFKNTVIPVSIGVFCMVLNIGLNFYFALVVGLGVYGIALATGLTSLLNMFLLVAFLRMKFLSEFRIFEWRRVGAIVFSSVLMGAAVYFVDSALSGWSGVSMMNQILALSAGILSGVVTFLVCIIPFGLEETGYLLRRLGFPVPIRR